MGPFLLFLTNLAFPFAAVGVLLGFVFSPRRRVLKHLKQELKERFALQSASKIPQQAIWLHCASVGEVMSVAGLAKELKQFYKKEIIFTTSTSAGKETALKNPDISAAFLAPLDCYPLSHNFIKKANPYRLFIIERDLWPNMIYAAQRADVPVALLNARISQKSTNAYRLVKPLFSMILRNLRYAALQSADDASRYQSLGLPPERTFVCGNVKYDTLNDTPAHVPAVDALMEKLGWAGSPILVCGSTHPLEEAILLDAAPELVKKGIKIIFAPRHLERKEEIETALQRTGLVHCFWTDKRPPEHSVILCIDAMGILQSAYTCASLTFVGGSIAPRGAHNLLEPAILNKTVLFGKSFHNTPDTASALLKQGGATMVDETNFKETVLRLIGNPTQLSNMSEKARSTALSFKGATKKIMEVVNKYE